MRSDLRRNAACLKRMVGVGDLLAIDLAEDVDREDGTESVDVDCAWDDPGDKVLPEDVELYDGDDRVARFSRRALLKAIHAKGRATTIAGRKVTASRGRTFFTLRINGVKGADRLRVRVRAAKLRGRGGRVRVHTQVTSSRRHR